MEALVLPAEDQFASKQNQRLANSNHCYRKNCYYRNLLPPNPKNRGSDFFAQSPQKGSNNLSFTPMLRKPYRSLKPNSPALPAASFPAVVADCGESYLESLRPQGHNKAENGRHYFQHDQKPKQQGGANKRKSGAGSGSDRKFAEKDNKGRSTAPVSSPKTPAKGRNRESFCFSSPPPLPPSFENWAGPAFSNSPPPSSLPLPKFSLRDRRSVSLELPVENSEFSDAVKASSMTKTSVSLPASPSREDSKLDVVSATMNLRRILNLDLD